MRVQEVELLDRKILVKVEIEDKLPDIIGDKTQLLQVFFNLIKNAMEAMPKGGELKILARADSEQIYLQFKDNGLGISQEDISRFLMHTTTKSVAMVLV